MRPAGALTLPLTVQNNPLPCADLGTNVAPNQQLCLSQPVQVLEKEDNPYKVFHSHPIKPECLTDRLINRHHLPLKTSYELSFRTKSNVNSNIHDRHVIHCFRQTQSRTMQWVTGKRLTLASSFRSDLFGTIMWVQNMFEKVYLTCPDLQIRYFALRACLLVNYLCVFKCVC